MTWPSSKIGKPPPTATNGQPIGDGCPAPVDGNVMGKEPSPKVATTECAPSRSHGRHPPHRRGFPLTFANRLRPRTLIQHVEARLIDQDDADDSPPTAGLRAAMVLS
jgi:hypothetical protein